MRLLEKEDWNSFRFKYLTEWKSFTDNNKIRSKISPDLDRIQSFIDQFIL